jgi:hypothetical protein
VWIGTPAVWEEGYQLGLRGGKRTRGKEFAWEVEGAVGGWERCGKEDEWWVGNGGR